MGYALCNVVFDVHADDLEEMKSVALIALNKEQTIIFDVLYTHDQEYPVLNTITRSELREPLRAVYLQSFDCIISETMLDKVCDLYYHWWLSIKSPNAMTRVTLRQIAITHSLIGNEGTLKNNPRREDYLRIYNLNTHKHMYPHAREARS